MAMWGEQNPEWKGEEATHNSKRQRARKRFRLGPCEMCGKPGKDRHHRDNDPGNNESSNVQILCRKCHMVADGRLIALRRNHRGPQPAKPCRICGREYKPLRKGRCGMCAQYFHVHGVERPKK